jgi:hypothetical protein
VLRCGVNSSASGYSPTAGFCEFGSVHLVSKKATNFLINLVSINEPGQLSRYSEQATGSTTEDSGFDFRQVKEIFLLFITSRPALESS